MADIFHTFPVRASVKNVFAGCCTPVGLNAWWTKNSVGKPVLNEVYNLDFGPQYLWKAIVSRFVADSEFELTITDADADWINTRVGFVVAANKGNTDVEFYHKGWPKNNEHYRISSYCWAMYLRILKRYLEFGELVPYEKRLDV
jgi:hypothetical protein